MSQQRLSVHGNNSGWRGANTGAASDMSARVQGGGGVAPYVVNGSDVLGPTRPEHELGCARSDLVRDRSALVLYVVSMWYMN